MNFVIDCTGITNKKPENTFKKEHDVNKLLEKYNNSLDEESSSLSTLKKKEEPKSNIASFIEEMGWTNMKPSNKEKPNKHNVIEILQKSVITPDFEQLHAVPPLEISKKMLKEQRKKEREKSKGKKWYGLPATEMTEERKIDLEILKMRSVLDPKHFYKKNDLAVLPKYFQIGKVLDSPIDYPNRLTKKERKKTLVDELLADQAFTRYNKRKYKEILDEKKKTHYKAYRNAKKLKRKNKK